MPTIVCRRLTYGYDGSEDNVFTDLDLVIDTTWRTALVGRNGRGKTTLLRLIDAQLTADKGAIEGRPATYYFPRGPEQTAESARTVAKDAVGPFRAWEREMEDLLDAGDEVSLQRYGVLLERYQQADGYQVESNLERELAKLGLDEALWSRPFASLSGGEQTRFLLAGLFVNDDGYPLIDEPTNHLDLSGRAMLAEYLSEKPGFLLVSHDRTFLDACIDHVVALNPDSVEVQRTSFSRWRRRFLDRIEAQAAKNVQLKGEIAALEATAQQRRTGAMKREATKTTHVDKGFIGARARRQMKRAIAAEQRAEKAAQARKSTMVDVEKKHALKLGNAKRQPKSIVTANELTVIRDRQLFTPVSFQIEPGDRLAIVGGNGSGKTSLMDFIAGANYAHTGAFVRPAHITLARAYQFPIWTSGSLRDHLQGSGIDESRFRQIMAVLGVRGVQLELPLESFSHGQLKKVDLARSFLTPADLLLWDEPLNFIDIDAREQIEAVLLQDQPTVAFIEHDATFIDKVATKSVQLLR
ncbi:MAG: ATP-binding cassette domain-containing protein [Gammaproteobacteria bacterium]|nr:ATP-binding cassette domain-containing protein [Gammaproteobacteria bacterium]